MGKSAGRAGVWSRLGARAERRPHPRRPGRRRTALGAGSQDVSGAPGRAVARSRCGAAGGGGGDADALAGQPLDCSGTAGLGIPTPPSSGSRADHPARSAATRKTSSARPGRGLPLGTTPSVGPAGHLLPGGLRPGLRTDGQPRLPLPCLARLAEASVSLRLSGTCTAGADPCGADAQGRQVTAAQQQGQREGGRPGTGTSRRVRDKTTAHPFPDLRGSEPPICPGGDRGTVMRGARGRCACVTCG